MDKRVSFHSETTPEILTILSKQPPTSLILSLTSLGLLKLPAEIGRLAKTEKLSINKNRLASLPIELGMLANLKFLNLRGNWFREFPDIVRLLLALLVDLLHKHICNI
jgi:Leucine-rich repeat (LRR) protein